MQYKYETVKSVAKGAAQSINEIDYVNPMH
jgi:hypothetical protein